MTLIKFVVVCLAIAEIATIDASSSPCTGIYQGDFDVLDPSGVSSGETITLQQYGCTVVASSSTTPLLWQGTLNGDSLTYEQDGVTYTGVVGTLFDDQTIEFEQFFLYPSENSDEPPHTNLLFWLAKAFVQVEDMVEDEQITRSEVTDFIVTQNANLKLGFDDAFMTTKANAVFDVFEVETDSDDVISEHDLKELENTIFNSTTAKRYEFIDEIINAIRLTDSEIEHVYNVWDKNGNGALSISDVTHWMRTHFPSTLSDETLDEIEATVNDVIEKYILGQSSFSLDEFKSLTNAVFDCSHDALRTMIDAVANEEELEADALILLGTCVQTETGFYPKHLAGMLGRAMYLVKDMLEDAQLQRDELLNFLISENEALKLGFDGEFITRKANAVFDVLERESDADDSIGEHDLLEIQDIFLTGTSTQRDQLIDELINAIRLSEIDIEHVWTVWDKNGNGVLSVADVFHWLTTHFPFTASEEDLAKVEDEINGFVENHLFGQSSFTLEEFKSLLNAAFDCVHSRANFLIDLLADEESSESEFGEELGHFLQCIQDTTGFTPKPSLKPSTSPSSRPSFSLPTSTPSNFPTFSTPTNLPTMFPTFSAPTNPPSSSPSEAPASSEPTFDPTTDSPSFAPSAGPTTSTPTSVPSQSPTTTEPTNFPSDSPSESPSVSNPTVAPTSAPVTSRPTDVPTASPFTAEPTSVPSAGPTTDEPTSMPSFGPSKAPSSSEPTDVPTTAPVTSLPTFGPSKAPSTEEPTNHPTDAPTTEEPTQVPTFAPSSSEPTDVPTAAPVTSLPTFGPSKAPSTEEPTNHPTDAPTTSRPTFQPTSSMPTNRPTDAPATSIPTFGPTTSQPTPGPTQTPEPTAAPVFSAPTVGPSVSPSLRPSVAPTSAPVTERPTFSPSAIPTAKPSTAEPSMEPSQSPTSSLPTELPTMDPVSSDPTRQPTTETPTRSPVTPNPTFNPTTTTTLSPTSDPTPAASTLVFELRGRSGSEIVVIQVGTQTFPEITLSTDWQRFAYPMPSSDKTWSVDFRNDAGGRDVYYRSDLLATMQFAHFAGWKCGQPNENSRCRTARDFGTLAWRGKYIWTLEEFGSCEGDSVLASECASLTAPAHVDGNTVVIPNGNGNNGAGRIRFSLWCEDGAEPLQLAIEGYWPTGRDDSYYVRLDNEDRRTWHTGRNGNHFHFRYAPSLSAPAKGLHTLAFEHREDGTHMRRARVISAGCRFTALNSQVDHLHVNVDGSNSCASGERITTEAECIQAAELLNVPYYGAYPIDYCAKGCFVYDGGAHEYNAVYFNTHSTGGEAADHHLVCSVAPEPETVEGTESSNTAVPTQVCVGNISTGNTRNYDNMLDLTLDETKSVTFSVRASNDAHIGFFSDSQSTHEVYEIVIGGWGNSKSVIRETSQGSNRVQASTRDILNGNQFADFWADAKDGLVRFGRGHVVGEQIVLQWQDPNPHTATTIGLMTGWGASGVWNVCVPAGNNGRRQLSNVDSGSTNRLLLIEQSVPF